MKSIPKSSELGKYFVIIIFFPVFFSSCQKQEDTQCECPENVFIGEYNLLPESRNSIPYTEKSIIFFNDSSGNEVSYYFDPDDQGSGTISLLSTTKCDCDNSRWKSYTASVDNYTFYIQEQSNRLNFSFQIFLSPNPFHGEEFMVADVMEIAMSDATGSGSGVLGPVLIDSRDLSAEYIKQYENNTYMIDQISFGEITFEDVYTNRENDFYYNFTEGIIAFTDQEGEMWFFSHLEILP